MYFQTIFPFLWCLSPQSWTPRQPERQNTWIAVHQEDSGHHNEKAKARYNHYLNEFSQNSQEIDKDHKSWPS